MRGPVHDQGGPAAAAAAAAQLPPLQDLEAGRLIPLAGGLSLQQHSSTSNSTSLGATTAVIGSGRASPLKRLMQQSGETAHGSSSSREQSQGCATRTWILMEYCGYGDLSTVLRNLRAVLAPTSQAFRVGNTSQHILGVYVSVSARHISQPAS
jgi:hypothetical protein